MKIDPLQGILSEAHFQPSTRCDERPEGMEIDMIVVHNISLPPGQFGTGDVTRFFCDELDFSLHPYFATLTELKAAAHVLIDRKGVITQFVPFPKRAWHAGQSSFNGRERCNDFSIGIELEGTDDLPFEKIQYEKLALVINSLRLLYPRISRDRIVGHSTIAPGRKTDPGPRFDWTYLDCLLDSESLNCLLF